MFGSRIVRAYLFSGSRQQVRNKKWNVPENPSYGGGLDGKQSGPIPIGQWISPPAEGTKIWGSDPLRGPMPHVMPDNPDDFFSGAGNFTWERHPERWPEKVTIDRQIEPIDLPLSEPVFRHLRDGSLFILHKFSDCSIKTLSSLDSNPIFGSVRPDIDLSGEQAAVLRSVISKFQGKLTPEQQLEANEMRSKDPFTWTQRNLAEHFDVSRLEISRTAKAPPAKRQEDDNLKNHIAKFKSRRVYWKKRYGTADPNRLPQRVIDKYSLKPGPLYESSRSVNEHGVSLEYLALRREEINKRMAAHAKAHPHIRFGSKKNKKATPNFGQMQGLFKR